MKTQGQTQSKGPAVAGKTVPEKINNLIRNLRRHPNYSTLYRIWKLAQAVQLVKVKMRE